MNPLYQAYETDKKVETEGVILEFGLNSKGKPIGIRIRRAGGANVAFMKVFEHESKPHRRMMNVESLDPAVSEKIMRETYAKTVVCGWENVEDRDGNPLEFNHANVIQLFTDLPDLFREIVKSSQDIALFRRELREADTEN